MIKVRYSSIDHVRKVRQFKSLDGARRFAVERVGERAEFGSNYAVSADGVGKIEVEGVSLAELFGRPAPVEWFALFSRDERLGDHQVGGPYAGEAAAQEAFWAWPEDQRAVDRLAIGKYRDDELYCWVAPKREFPPQPPFAVVRVDPVYSAIHDGLVGHNSKIVSQHADLAEAEAECARQCAAGGEPVEYGDYGFEVRRWVAPVGPYRDGYYGPRVASAPQPSVAESDDEIPF